MSNKSWKSPVALLIGSALLSRFKLLRLIKLKFSKWWEKSLQKKIISERQKRQKAFGLQPLEDPRAMLGQHPCLRHGNRRLSRKR